MFTTSIAIKFAESKIKVSTGEPLEALTESVLLQRLVTT